MMALFIFHKTSKKIIKLQITDVTHEYRVGQKALISNLLNWRTLMCDVTARLCFINIIKNMHLSKECVKFNI